MYTLSPLHPLQTSKGYHHDHHVDKGGKGFKTDERHRKEYEEAAGKKKKHHDHAGHKGSHEEEAFGHRGAKFDEKKGHKKGHKTKGKFHLNIFPITVLRSNITTAENQAIFLWEELGISQVGLSSWISNVVELLVLFKHISLNFNWVSCAFKNQPKYLNLSMNGWSIDGHDLFDFERNYHLTIGNSNAIKYCEAKQHSDDQFFMLIRYY